MLEIELKFRVDSFASVVEKLESHGARCFGARDETDDYYNAPDRDFKLTDEVFRLRCEADDCVLTYKGPKRPGTVKTREEIEVPLAVGRQEAAMRLIRSLGYRLTATVRKRRSVYSLVWDGFDLHVCLDSLAGVGEFVEIEIVAAESDLQTAEAVVQRFAGVLGLMVPEPRAYLRMVLEAEGSDR
jgi:adenylate cyclase class 2